VAEDPAVTVAIPTRNRRALTERAIRSVQAQTYRDWRLVVLDNASTDGTAEMVAALGDDRIRYVRHDHDLGHRRNITLALHAGGASPFTAVLFSDDEFAPRHLERKVAFLEAHPEVGLVHSAYRLVGPDGSVLRPTATMAFAGDGEIETSRQFVRRSFRDPCRVWFSTAVLRTWLAATLEAREQDHPADDHRVWLEAGFRAPVAYLDDPLATMRVAPGWSTGAGFQDIGPDGDYHQSLSGLLGERRIRQEFLLDHDLGLAESWRLRRTSNACYRRRVARTIRGRYAGVRIGQRSARTFWWRAALADAAVLVDPRTWKVLLGR
jgi:glycosyltransferase involved in cell wall biosynthesis